MVADDCMKSRAFEPTYDVLSRANVFQKRFQDLQNDRVNFETGVLVSDANAQWKI